MKLDLTKGTWINPPTVSLLQSNQLIITTDANTDFWQRTYYGFRNENAPALLFEQNNNFTLSGKLTFNYKQRFDQCGLIIFIDEENWFKVSIEYENAEFSRLGSVVTNLGYSDWATTDIAKTK